jgi:hypothetical protein
MELFYFDIETAGNYPDYTKFYLEDERGSELFREKYEKLNWSEKYQNVDEAYIDQGGIVSTYGRICCISFGYFDNDGNKRISSFYGEDEKDIINSFNNLLIKIEKKKFKLSGYRILHFDIPWILHKLHKYKIKPADIILLYDKKPWENRIVDISDDWKLKFAYQFSFDEACYELGVKSPKEKMNGSHVHKKFWDRNYVEIKDYCEMDVSSLMDVSNSIYNTI